MDGVLFESEHPKKRRRRRVRRRHGQQPLPSRLMLDDELQGDVGSLSEDLWIRLQSSEVGDDDINQSRQNVIYVAISPQTPLATIIEDPPWTIICIKRRAGTLTEDVGSKQTIIQLPAKCGSARSFLHQLDLIDPNRRLMPGPTAIDVRAVKVKLIPLDTVYVKVEKNLLQTVDDAQRRFGGGFNEAHTNGFKGRTQSTKPGKKREGTTAYWNTSGSPQDRLAKVIREAVSIATIIREGDAIPLPLPSHPITHTCPPPAIISACSPVAQGSISAKTRIIVLPTEAASEKAATQKSVKAPPTHVVEQEAEDTSNELFYSAVEEREDEGVSGPDEDLEQSETEHSSHHSSDDVSDDSLEDMISLHAPDVHPQQHKLLSGTTNATPRPGGHRYIGTHTPGSAHSSFSAATARIGVKAGRVCRAKALSKRISVTMLHPRPSDKDDDEAFVFVDMKTLTKIGCFSGDWIRVEKCEWPYMNGLTSLNFGHVGNFTEESPDWRAVRVFGLPQEALRKPQYTLSGKNMNTSMASRGSFVPAVYVPPVLLNNLDAPSFLKLSALFKQEVPRTATSKMPPLAREVRLSKVSTPSSTKKEQQSGLFAGLKQHFQQRSRTLKVGDLIAVPLDEEAGRVTSSNGQAMETDGDDTVGDRLSLSFPDRVGKYSIAWFVVDQVIPEDTTRCNLTTEDRWDGVFLVESSKTRITQAGNSTRGIPESLANTAALWAGIKKLPWTSSFSAAKLSPGPAKLRPYVLPLQRRLTELIRVATSSRAISLGMPPLSILLHSSRRLAGKSYIACSAALAAGAHTFTISAHDILSDGGSPNGGGDVKSEIALKTRVERASSCGSRFTTLLITHIEMLMADRMISALSEAISESRIFIATTTELENIPDGIRSLFSHELEVGVPSEVEREGILHNACLQQSLRLDPSVQLESVALKTAALVASDLVDVVHRTSLARDQRLESLAASKDVSASDIQYSGGWKVSRATAADFSEAISSARSNFSDSIGAPKIPTVTWKDVGGLADQKSSIMETISLPLAHPELFAKGMRKRSGMLFYGPPGTGKTLLAKAIATEFSLNFFSVKGPELLNMYIGESEANVRRVFQKARDARPCVVFFDELDSVAPKRGNQGDSGGVMDRIVSQLLAELDGMSSGGPADGDLESGSNGDAGGVFVIGATNRPDLLDPALLRPGRFDKMLYLGVSSSHDQQLTILEALTRKFTLAPKVDLSRVASRLPFTYTGADLYALCSDAMLKAITKKTRQVDARVREASAARGEEISTAYYFDHLARPEDTAVIVSEDDFAAAQNELVASVSAKELAHFERIRLQFEKQDVSSMAKEAWPEKEPPPLATWSSLPMRKLDQLKPMQPPAPNSDPNRPVKGTGKGKAIANPDSGPDDSEGRNEEYLRNHRVGGSANNHNPIGKRESKAAMKGRFVDTEEDLYSS